ncbi:MAG TPA: hypothetical protein DIW31_09755 [Bacteroidales bacterium]|nr:hypothetical protein [Bacteroidales bacterium]
MKKRIIIGIASVAVLALIVVVAIGAQSSKKENTVATEKTDSCMPESCKDCPSAATCMDATAPADTTACKAKCTDKKNCDKADCAKCDKKETCAKTGECVKKDCPNKKEASTCPKSAGCKKDCKKK